VDLFFTAIISASSVALFCYWFRYGCLLILAARTARDYSEEVAKSNQLSFRDVRSTLRSGDVTDLDSLHRSLERDFEVIACLSAHTPLATFDTGFEDAMLKIHFRAMSTWFRLTRRNLRGFALDALEEMSLVVAHFANAMGERIVTEAGPGS